MRLGIHRGAFAFEEVLGQRNSIGTGINLACRITGHGDGDHILLTAEAGRVLSRIGLAHGQYVVPIGEAGVKHNVGVLLYSYFRESQRGLVFGRKENTKTGGRQIKIDALVLSVLQHLELRLTAILGKYDVDASDAGLRLTILASTDLS